MLPEAGGLFSWAQQNGVDILLTVMIFFTIYLLFRREIGSLIGVLCIVGILVVCINNPDATIVKLATGLVNKLFGIGTIVPQWLRNGG